MDIKDTTNTSTREIVSKNGTQTGSIGKPRIFLLQLINYVDSITLQDGADLSSTSGESGVSSVSAGVDFGLQRKKKKTKIY